MIGRGTDVAQKSRGILLILTPQRKRVPNHDLEQLLYMSITTQPGILIASTTHTFPTASTTYTACTWPGHCLGASCHSNDDCDNDWICSNLICSPCCETLNTSSATVSPTPSQSESASGGGLKTTTAIGIGVGAAAVVIICMAVGFWICHKRRKRRKLVEAPDTQRIESELEGIDHFATDGEHKRLFATTTAELPCPTVPTELHSVELVELEGSVIPERELEDGGDSAPDSSDAEGDHFLPRPEQVATLRSRQARFEEYTISPDHLTPHQWNFSPVSLEEQRYSASSETSTISSRRPHRRTTSSGKTTSPGGPYESLRRENPTSSYTLNPRNEQACSATADNPTHGPTMTSLSLPQSVRAPASPGFSSLSPREQSRRFHHPFRSPSSPTSPGDDTALISSEDPNAPYILFGWPSNPYPPR
ncbi:hypothetical protein K458DRAFT_392256 [Lentithecium fluviatile CBS 122367]|uniref:Uncharacterized protein n=1 Tax=Lentithecium fluviatile CBS 122367 TaxID=1168545 RepID=A0A6G1IS15_9PLEO|nr:hypothetical protein K458DRAFT_392256 [Lentithecium fluviatile CBS 122367]